MGQKNNIPNFDQRFMERGVNSKDWYFFLVGLYNGLPQSPESGVTPGVSPYEYSAPIGGSMIVNGGTVSNISFSRDGTTFYTTGQTSGMFPLNAQDRLRITYTVVPTLTFVPS